MSKEFSGLAHAALASGALVLPGCGGDQPPSGAHTAAAVKDSAAPTIASASIAGGVLSLHFSEAIAAPANVDPRKFRLTFAHFGAHPDAYYYDYYYSSSKAPLTWYTDMGRFAPETTPLQQAAPDTIQIALPQDFKPSWVCADIARMKKRGAAREAGLYLHYSEAGNPTITDLNGNQLKAVAPYWQTAKASATVGDFANKPIPVRLSCG